MTTVIQQHGDSFHNIAHNQLQYSTVYNSDQYLQFTLKYNGYYLLILVGNKCNTRLILAAINKKVSHGRKIHLPAESKMATKVNFSFPERFSVQNETLKVCFVFLQGKLLVTESSGLSQSSKNL